MAMNDVAQDFVRSGRNPAHSGFPPCPLRLVPRTGRGSAKTEGLTLTETHWEVCVHCRNWVAECGTCPECARPARCARWAFPCRRRHQGSLWVVSRGPPGPRLPARRPGTAAGAQDKGMGSAV